MIEIKTSRDKAKLRGMALSSQKLLKRNYFGKGLNAVEKVIEHLGYIQIDTISVVERAHHHVLQSRVTDYTPKALEKLQKDAVIFEYWSHAAAFLPMTNYRFSLPYKNAIKRGLVHWNKNPDRELMKEVLLTIEQEGPMRSRDFDTAKQGQNGWWNWKPAKKAIEQLFMEGDLMVARRDGFQKVYDLTERVLPTHIDSSLPTLPQFAEHLISEQLRCHGVVSYQGFTYLRKNPELKKLVKSKIEQKLRSGEYEEIVLSSSERFVCEASSFNKPLEKVNEQISILSPFDNCVIQRKRLKEIFQFDYQIECYVPEAKRQFGYFSLPLLYRDVFVGRMDCKAHRKEKRLEIKALHFELHLINKMDVDRLALTFAEEIKQFSHFQSCDSIDLKTVEPAFLKDQINKEILTVSGL